MEKLRQLTRPFLAVILGTLLMLVYINLLPLEGEALALGIIGLIVGVYYVATGILKVLLLDKFSEKTRKVVGVISVSLFPLFMFVSFLLRIVRAAELLTPTGWIISIISLVGSLGLAVVFCLANIVRAPLLKRLAQLFVIFFVVIMIVDVVFDTLGDPNALGAINVANFAIYFFYGDLLFASLIPFYNEDKNEEIETKEEEPEE